MKITDDILYVGVNDHKVDLFEGQYIVPNGMAYNSYVIRDEKIAVMDTVDINFTEEWLGNVAKVLDGASIDSMIMQTINGDFDYIDGVSYFIPDMDDVAQKVVEVLYVPVA